jgi:hypothetical protein
MTAVRTSEPLNWLAPAPLWGDGGLGVEAPQLVTPWIVELAEDQFTAQFLGIMGAEAGALPTDIATMAPAVTDAANGAYRLFQPLNQRYYLVTASLVCRRPGLPDHAVNVSHGESTTFVLRQMVNGTEQALVAGSWTTASSTALVPGEQQLPMHGAPVAGFAATGSFAANFGMSTAGRRTVHYGYIPVALREKATAPIADPVGALNALNAAPGLVNPENPLVDELMDRVVQPWSAIITAPSNTNIDYGSLYLILDFGDWLNTNLPAVYNAITGSGTLTSGSAQETLLQAIQSVTLLTGPAPPQTLQLDQAISDLAGYETLLSGTGNGPNTSYDLASSSVSGTAIDPTATLLQGPGVTGSLANLALQALGEAKAPISVPPELVGMVKNDPVALGPGQVNPTYFVRAVYQHSPCAAVLSQPSPPFELARAFDADAPARQVRIQIPDVTNMRKFKKGIVIELPPSLRRITDRVNPALLQGGGLGTDPGSELGLICVYSLQIFLVLSFMVAFIFLLVFNLLFFWLPFIKVTFPLPVPTEPPGPPSP